jgi:DNA replication protein DnaC
MLPELLGCVGIKEMGVGIFPIYEPAEKIDRRLFLHSSQMVQYEMLEAFYMEGPFSAVISGASGSGKTFLIGEM